MNAINPMNGINAMHGKIKTLIVDDEELARRLVREFLRCHEDIEIIGECENGLEALEAIGTQNPDLIFLDIQMPKLTGLEVLELSGRSNGVVFTTAYDQYALKAFDLHAVDYLLKPFSQARFDEALARARQMLELESPEVKRLLAGEGQMLERILIRDRGQVHVVPVEKLEHAEALDDYIQLHSEGRSFLKTQSLSDLETRLDPKSFVRIHRSHIVNIRFVARIERASKDSQVVVLRNGEKVPVSRSGQEKLKMAMGQ